MNEIENAGNTSSQTTHVQKKSSPKNFAGTIICLILMIVMAISALLLFQNVVSKGAETLADSYKAALASEKETAYQVQYKKYYDAAEAANHVKNRASIYIGNIKETDKLEVLKVSDVEFIVEDSKNNKEKITSWLEVPGEGIFVVDLKAAEFIIDDERAYVLVRLPYPELTNVSIDYSNVKKILFKDDIFNGSYKQGEELARKQLGEADLLLKKEFSSNERFYLDAQEAAVSTIECLIRQLNPSIEDLFVEIEFY